MEIDALRGENGMLEFQVSVERKKNHRVSAFILGTFRTNLHAVNRSEMDAEAVS
jgi:hypothetical protein